MTDLIPMTDEELQALEREVREFGGLDRDAAEVVLAEIRRCWREIADLRARLAKQGRPHATRKVAGESGTAGEPGPVVRQPKRRTMDTWKFYDITHREHVICNPTSEEKLDRLVELLRLPADARVVDIACGKGEFLTRLAEAYGICCVGIDLSPFFVAEAQRRLRARAPDAQVVFLQMNGADFGPDEPHSFTVASCIGASWVYGGHAETLDALTRMVVPGGWVIAGEPYWRQEPSEEYLQASGVAREAFGTHVGNAEVGEQRGLDLVHTLVSNQDDWDRYEGLQWYATVEYARSHPDDPDLPELLRRVAKERTAYLRWGRDTLGWAIYVFRRRIPAPPASTP